METILYIIFSGLMIGILISAPMGPIGVLVIQRTLNRGRRKGLATGLGASLSDIIYCLLTAFGLSFITGFISTHRAILQCIGSIVLVVYGIYLFINNPSKRVELPRTPAHSGTFLRDFATGFLLTFSNPLILFFIIGLFARFSFLAPEFQAYHYVAGYASIFAGAVLWWFGVTWFVNKVRAHFNLRSLWLLNRIVGGIIMIMGAIGLITALHELLVNH